MVLSPITAARVTVACLAASLGLGSFWTKVQTPLEQPVSRAANVTGFGTLHNDAVVATEKLKTPSASLVDNFVADVDEYPHSSKIAPSLAHFDGVSTMEASGATVNSHRLPAIATIQPLPITEVAAPVGGATGSAFMLSVFVLVWPIVASLPLDCLLMLLFFVWRRWRCSGKKLDQSTALDERSPNGNAEASHDWGDALGDAMVSLQQNDTFLSFEEKQQRTSLESVGEPKAWTEKQRELGDIVKNTQATATTSAAHDGGHAENAVPLDAAPQSLRNRSRSGAEFKALMEKKRGECHVLEGTQKHVYTDAQAAGCPSKLDSESDAATHKADMDFTVAAPARRRNTSSKDVKEWMSRLKGQCEVIEGPAPMCVETDAKSGARPAQSRPDKDNNANAEETSATAGSSQGHVNIDAKAGRCPLRPDGKNEGATFKVYVDSTLTASPASRCNTSSKEVKEWMSRLKDRCEVIEGPAPSFVETDAKSSAPPAKSQSNKENIGYYGVI